MIMNFEFIFIPDAKIGDPRGPRGIFSFPRLLKIVHQIGNDFVAKTFDIQVAKGIGDRDAVKIEEMPEMAVIHAEDGIDGHLYIDKAMVRHGTTHVPSMSYNGFYKRIYTKEPMEIYEQVKHHMEKKRPAQWSV